jgi:hypothetical protein
MFLTYNTKSLNKIKHVYHGYDVMARYKDIFPVSKYESYTPNKFSLTVLHIIYTYNPSSIYVLMDHLKNIEYQAVNIWYQNIQTAEERI